MNLPNDPENADLARREARAREMDRGEGMGAIIAIVAVAALIIVGMLYIMQAPPEARRAVTSEAPTVTNPVPAPKPDTAQ
jgi:hypothetical protein